MSQPLSRLGRTQDLEDIRALIRANRATLNLTEVREYFLLFDRAALLLGAGKHQTKVELVRKNEIKKAKTEPVKLPPAQPAVPKTNRRSNATPNRPRSEP